MNIEKQFIKQVNNEENSQEKKTTRREFIKKTLKLAGAVAVGGVISNEIFKDEKNKEEVFDNEAYLKLKKKFEDKGLTNSREYKEFEARFGERAFNMFRKKYNLSKEEAEDRWSSAITRRSVRFIERAEKWQRIEKIAKEAGEDPNGNLHIEAINGEVTVNGKRVHGKETKKEEPKQEKQPKRYIESPDINTDIY